MLKLPGIPYDGAPVGPDESFNKVIRTDGELPQVRFRAARPCRADREERLGRPQPRSTQVSGSADLLPEGRAGAARDQADGLGAGAGSRRPASRRSPCRRSRASRRSSTRASSPGISEETYQLPNDDLWLAGTAEVVLTSLHSGEIIEARQAADPLRRLLALLPPRGGERGQGRARAAARPPVREGRAICDLRGRRRAVGRVACEAARAGRRACFSALEIPYQVIETSTGDMGLGKYRMNDIESWVPSLGKYRETHSCSTLHDWQARRANIRYRGADGKVRFAHTLNNTALASPRILVPLLENHQTADGRVKLPKALQELMGGEYLCRCSWEGDDALPPLRLAAACEAAWLAAAAAGAAFGRRRADAGRRTGRRPGHPRLHRVTTGRRSELRRALARSGWRVHGWELGINWGAQADTVEQLRQRLDDDLRRTSRCCWSAGAWAASVRARAGARGAGAGARGGDARLALFRRSAAEQCVAALRAGRRAQGRRSADAADHRQAAGAARWPSGRAGTG